MIENIMNIDDEEEVRRVEIQRRGATLAVHPPRTGEPKGANAVVGRGSRAMGRMGHCQCADGRGTRPRRTHQPPSSLPTEPRAVARIGRSLALIGFSPLTCSGAPASWGTCCSAHGRGCYWAAKPLA